jgi:hypothetical protein
MPTDFIARTYTAEDFHLGQRVRLFLNFRDRYYEIREGAVLDSNNHDNLENPPHISRLKLMVEKAGFYIDNEDRIHYLGSYKIIGPIKRLRFPIPMHYNYVDIVHAEDLPLKPGKEITRKFKNQISLS